MRKYDRGYGWLRLVCVALVSILLLAGAARAEYFEEWTVTNGSVTEDVTFGMTLDSSGNIFTVGYTYVNHPPNYTDIYISKFDPDGNELWTRSLGTTYYEQAYCVAVDSTGNSYVSGFAYSGFDGVGGLGGREIPLVKYDPSGNKLWTKLYGAGNGADWAKDIKIGPSGYLYITGYYAGYYFRLMKVDPANGNVVWERTIEGGPTVHSNALCIDQFENIYACGRVYGGSFDGNVYYGNNDVFAIKYDSDGNKLWSMQWANKGGNFSQEAEGITVDNSGGVFVVGVASSDLAANIPFILKLSQSDGSVQWWNVTSDPGYSDFNDVVVDFDGNLIAVGELDVPGSTDMHVKKLSSVDGSVIWSYSSGATNTIAYRVVRSGASIFVAGQSGSDINGATQLGSKDGFIMKLSDVVLESDPPTSVITDPAGSMTMPTPLKHYTIRGTADDGVGSGVESVDISTDGGSTWNRVLGTDNWFYHWAFPCNGTYNIRTRATDGYENVETPGPGIDLTIDNPPISGINVPSDHEFVNPSMGIYTVTGISADFSCTSLTGVEVSTDSGSSWNTANNDSGDWTDWSYEFTPLPLGAHTIKARATDASPRTESIYPSVTLIVDGTAPTCSITDPTEAQEIDLAIGVFTVNGTASDGVGGQNAGVNKVQVTIDGGATWHDATGAANWTYGWAPPALGTYSIQARAIDNVNNYGVPTSGVHVNIVNNPYDFLWTRMNGTPGTDRAMDVVTDAAGNSYAVGYTGGSFAGYTSAGSSDIVLTKYDAGGNMLWTIQDGTPLADYGMGVDLDKDGNIYITGYTYGDLGGNGNAGGSDAFVIKYDPSGKKLWTYQSDESGEYLGRATAVGQDGRVYLAGSASYTSSFWEYYGLITVLDDTGAYLFKRSVNIDGTFYIMDIAFDKDGYCFVAGYGIYNGYTDYDIVFVRYDPPNFNKSWIKFIGTYGNDRAYGVTTDPDGNFIIAGNTDSWFDGCTNAGDYDPFDNAYTNDIVLCKYDRDGNRIWLVETGTPEHDIAYGVATDSVGSIYVTGYTEGVFTGCTSMGSRDVFVKRFNPNGLELFTRQIGTSGNDIGVKVSVDPNDMVYVAGASYGDLEGNTNQGAYDLFVSKLGPELSSVISDPTDGQIVNTNDYLVTGMAFDYSVNDVQTVEVSTDGGTTWDTATDTSGDSSWSTWEYANWTSIPTGTYNLRSRATNDVALVETPGVGVTVTVDNSPPVTTFTYPTTGAALNGVSAVLTGAANDDGLGITLVEVSDDGGSNWYAATDTSGNGSWSTWSYGWTLPTDGIYVLRSRGTDAAGNVETPSAGETVFVDNTPPASSVTDPSDGAMLSGASYTMNGSASDNLSGVDSVEVSTDGGSTWAFADYTGGTAWSYDWTLPAIDGAYNIITRATDTAGNTETPGAGITLNVDNSLPTSAITLPADGAFFSTATSITVSGTASDGGSDDITELELSFDGGQTWISVSGSKTAWSYIWSVGSNGDYNIKSRATDLAGNVEVPGPGVGVTVFDRSLTSPELVHTSWDTWLTVANCAECHVTPATFLPADFRQRPEYCHSCHNPSAAAHDRNPYGPAEHPVMINVTGGTAVFPTYGNITAAEFDNRLFANLYDTDKVVCSTCHNQAKKTEDIGRVWELTTTSDNLTYSLQNGGWSGAGRYVPQVYRDASLISAPTLVKDRKSYLVDASEYTYDEGAGTVTFAVSQDPATYVYVTLDFPYLRVSTYGNHLCSDCHTEHTHMGVNCLTCHDVHYSGNIGGVAETVRTTDMSERAVVFVNHTGANSLADGDGTFDGICEVCHTATLYHRNDGTGLANHTGTGIDYSGKDCTACHTHASGFAK